MKYFLDTEFIEGGRDLPIQLISIGMVCEDGRMYYAESGAYNPDRANDWVKQNVFPQLTGPRKSLELIKPEFWGYYCDYDWVVFCQIFGAMIDLLPMGWPMYCRDLKQWADEIGNPHFHTPKPHNALQDARWNAAFYLFLAEKDPRPRIWPKS
jgi:hypothetical protein